MHPTLAWRPVDQRHKARLDEAGDRTRRTPNVAGDPSLSSGPRRAHTVSEKSIGSNKTARGYPEARNDQLAFQALHEIPEPGRTHTWPFASAAATNCLPPMSWPIAAADQRLRADSTTVRSIRSKGPAIQSCPGRGVTITFCTTPSAIVELK